MQKRNEMLKTNQQNQDLLTFEVDSFMNIVAVWIAFPLALLQPRRADLDVSVVHNDGIFPIRGCRRQRSRRRGSTNGRSIIEILAPLSAVVADVGKVFSRLWITPALLFRMRTRYFSINECKASVCSNVLAGTKPPSAARPEPPDAFVTLNSKIWLNNVQLLGCFILRF